MQARLGKGCSPFLSPSACGSVCPGEPSVALCLSEDAPFQGSPIRMQFPENLGVEREGRLLSEPSHCRTVPGQCVDVTETKENYYNTGCSCFIQRNNQ
jgi:hypothetical protein